MFTYNRSENAADKLSAPGEAADGPAIRALGQERPQGIQQVRRPARKGSALCAALEAAVGGPRFVTHASLTARPFFESRGYRVIRAQQDIDTYQAAGGAEGRGADQFCDGETDRAGRLMPPGDPPRSHTAAPGEGALAGASQQAETGITSQRSSAA